MRFRVVDTNVINERGEVTHKRYRIIDTEDPGDPSKHGVYEDKGEAESECNRLNLEHPDNLVEEARFVD
ncbi:hypothetical protein NRB16_08030 [Pseudomonas sp. LJDD11]|uniref:hypothetical protein n=1 Tax=Pseudomonas sp. LJDD11 TaxID=2931984 RepID=UPI00211C32F3|nr:hypothetical protein [Pseudomonas sp. LJDD11]MCQ9423468.1 hypothetical protein [Pseudomonas sp. LJDD11]